MSRRLKEAAAMKLCGWQAKKRKGNFGTEIRSLRRWQAQDAGRGIKLKPWNRGMTRFLRLGLTFKSKRFNCGVFSPERIIDVCLLFFLQCFDNTCFSQRELMEAEKRRQASGVTWNEITGRPFHLLLLNPYIGHVTFSLSICKMKIMPYSLNVCANDWKYRQSAYSNPQLLTQQFKGSQCSCSSEQLLTSTQRQGR